jgi:UDPglucose 6-dehydrogenase
MQRKAHSAIGIMGAGVVGGSLRAHLEERGNNVAVYDPPKGFDSIDVLADADIVFVCVPTPYTPGVGFDNRYLTQAVASIPGSRIVVIKSTVLPGTTEMMQERFPQHRFMFNPEFLREATAFEDFVRPDRQIVGYTAESRDAVERVMELLPRAPFERICRASEAEMAKYVANSFLAVKVSYANDVFDLCDRLRIDYASVRDMAAADERIGASHMDVFDGGYRGYGGKCLPKDSKSLLDLARSVGIDMQVLRAADRVNASLRPDELTAPRVLVHAADDAPEATRRAA